MKRKLLASILTTASLWAIAALADETMTSPVYLPSEGEILSDTALSYQRTKYKHAGAKEDLRLAETVMFGADEESAVLLSLSNRFNTAYLSNRDYNNDLNLDYELGYKKNFRTNGGLVMQLGGSYYTYNPRSWYGRSGEAKAKIRELNGGNTRWYKELRGDIKLGYEVDETLLPYGEFGIRGNVDDADRDLYYTGVFGVHKLENGYSYDAALRCDFDFNDDDSQAWYMQGAADYFISDAMTIGAFADLQFAGSTSPKVDYDYTGEVRFKVLF
jgi:hypothetical protein